MQKIPLLLTRPEGSNAAFAAEFPMELQRELDFIDCPLLRITSLNAQFSMPRAARAIFTSSNAVPFAPPSLGRTAYCVGSRTTEVARSAGWVATCAGKNAADLVAKLSKDPPAQELYHFSGVHVRGNVVADLIALDLLAKRIVLYDQDLLPISAEALAVLSQKLPVIVPLFSPRTAEHFVTSSNHNANAKLIMLSSAVRVACRKANGFDTMVAPEPTAKSVIACVEKLVGSIRLG